ncbi:MAG: HNH endonuclease [Thermoleophilia bacterium]|jgi:5-methylcytosine-specific restriction endonuclease McrA|nr:HNH endonuclease [Thermoleophilia bacterium]
MAHQVLVLNATYEPINVCSIQRAMVLLLKEKAEILEEASRRLRGVPGRTYPCPHVIRLHYRVRVPRYEARRITRRALFARDGYECQYCGAQNRLTVDHVVPRSRGGRSSWDNVVTSCAPCNSRKGNALPAEIEMFPKTTPRPPAPAVFIAVAAPRRPPSWAPYLALAS